MKRLIWLVVALTSGGCTVDRSVLDTGLFACATDADCGPGWGCVTGQEPYVQPFCAPTCGTAGGTCPQGSTCLENRCIRDCLLGADGTASACQNPAFQCTRTTAAGTAGLCYPVRACTTAAQCGAGELCLSEAFGIPRLYCVPGGPLSTTCPVGTTIQPVSSTTAVCAPLCDAASTECPPGFACLTQLSLLASADFPARCVTGAAGLACQSNANCLLGSCVATPTQGQVCALTCGEASLIAGGCAALSPDDQFLSAVYRLECDATPAAKMASSDGTGLCVPRYNLGMPCTPANGAYPCAMGLFCETGASTCTKACRTNADCAPPIDTFLNYVCVPNAGGAGVGRCAIANRPAL